MIVKKIKELHPYLDFKTIEIVHQALLKNTEYPNTEIIFVSNMNQQILINVFVPDIEIQESLIPYILKTITPFLPGHHIKLNVITSFKKEIERINSDELKAWASLCGLRIVDIAFELGMLESNVGAWFNDKKPLSYNVKSLFFFYFKWKRKEQIQSFSSKSHP